jgi:hypothetical protein
VFSTEFENTLIPLVVAFCDMDPAGPEGQHGEIVCLEFEIERCTQKKGGFPS